jgi:hypothetical protein
MGEGRSQNIMGRGWLNPYLYLTHTSPCSVHEQEQPSRLHENYWEVGPYTVCPVWRLVRDNHISLGCLVWRFNGDSHISYTETGNVHGLKQSTYRIEMTGASGQVDHGVQLELSGLEEVFLLQTVTRYLTGGSRTSLRFTIPELCSGAKTFWGSISEDGDPGGIFNVNRCLSDRSGIEDFWTQIASRRQHTPDRHRHRGDNNFRHRRLLWLLEARTVAETARQLVGHTPDYAGIDFTRDIATTSGILETGRGQAQEKPYSIWVFMGYIPQILDSDRWLLAELSADEGPSSILASVLRDLQEETDPLGYWRERQVQEIARENQDDQEYVEPEQGEETKKEEAKEEPKKEESQVETDSEFKKTKEEVSESVLPE